MAAKKELLQNLAPDLKKKLRDGVKKQSVKIKCSECRSSLGNWSIRGLGSNKILTCKNKKCGHSVKVDVQDVNKVISSIDAM